MLARLCSVALLSPTLSDNARSPSRLCILPAAATASLPSVSRMILLLSTNDPSRVFSLLVPLGLLRRPRIETLLVLVLVVFRLFLDGEFAGVLPQRAGRRLERDQ